MLVQERQYKKPMVLGGKTYNKRDQAHKQQRDLFAKYDRYWMYLYIDICHVFILLHVIFIQVRLLERSDRLFDKSWV